jgi:hypothetical protein
MISFNTLGKTGARFGNQLFQYVFLRTQAKKLGVQFYCPRWAGDTVFMLHDNDQKCEAFVAEHTFTEGSYTHGFNKEATEIVDDTEINGYFQSYKFFKNEDILEWLSFDETLLQDIKNKYRNIDFSKASALHVRLGDYLHPNFMFYAPTPAYFKEALRVLNPQGSVLIFSEDVIMTKKYLGDILDGVIFIEGNKDYEDFYLMSLCKNIVCSASSFSWWAAYLNKNQNKKIIMPASWFLPMSRVKNIDLFVDGWIRLKAHRSILDNYYVRLCLSMIKDFII